jgi:hypothetical protein
VSERSYVMLALLLYCWESLTVLARVLIERGITLASQNLILVHHLVVPYENADQIPFGVFLQMVGLHMFYIHMEQSPGF